MSDISIADDLFEELKGLIESSNVDYHARYGKSYSLMLFVLNEATRNSDQRFSGPFARLVYLCRIHQYSHDEYLKANALRIRCAHLSDYKEEELRSCFLSDMATLCGLIEKALDAQAPSALRAVLPQEVKSIRRSSVTIPSRNCRGVVAALNEQELHVIVDRESDELLKVDYSESDYLSGLLKIGSRVNLIGLQKKEDFYVAELIIFEPDYLVDITTISNCFGEYCDSAKLYLINRFKPSPNTKAILLGNLAGQMLDEEIHHAEDQVPYTTSIKNFFKSNPLGLAACTDDLSDFHADAQWQQRIIRNEVQQFGRKDSIMLEPSFVCELLGIQGRMDLLTQDLKMLVEQKSGKRDEMSRGHKESHYVQMLLYLALLHYNYDLPNEQVSCYLFYSKYDDGFIAEGPAPQLLAEAIKIRNQIVGIEQQISQGTIAKELQALKPEQFRTKAVSDRFWDVYLYPQISNILNPIQNASLLEQRYFFRYLSFVSRELMMAKMGAPGREDFGFSSLWNSRIADREENGDILYGINITELISNQDKGIERVKLQMPQSVMEGLVLPNFRLGDIVVLYSYAAAEQPDVRNSFIFRCTVASIEQGYMSLDLRFPQKNETLFAPKEPRLWAIEHDFMESSYTALYRHLHSFLLAPNDRRKLLLNERQPRVDESQKLNGSYGKFDSLVLHAKQARDFFLVVGPPGTGKTSFGLMNLVKEELSNPASSILLLSYTNRAVDEICSKLKGANIDFVRIGNGVACPEEFRSHLLKERTSGISKVNGLRDYIAAQRVYVSTTTSMASNSQLFALRHFSLAIIDEASQILEPNLLGILSAHDHGVSCIDRFILIGDHKQLSSIVLESSQESAVEDSELNNIGLMSCGQSLFERLIMLHKGNPQVMYLMSEQGRMHPEVAEYANRFFYGNELGVVGMPHQHRDLAFDCWNGSTLGQILSRHRQYFFSVSNNVDYPTSYKTNEAESQLIVAIAKTIYLMYVSNGREFRADDTIGIIVPYRHQIANIRQKLLGCGIAQLSEISIDTVERFQGSQRDVIIYGFTVQRPYQLLFLESNNFVEQGAVIDRKLNVALTRAKEQQFIVGDADLLQKSSVFSSLIGFMKEKGCFCDKAESQLLLSTK